MLENVTREIYSRDIKIKPGKYGAQIPAENYLDSLDAMLQEWQVDAIIVTNVHHIWNL